jgi:putative RNA 2'-phosphotransferase
VTHPHEALSKRLAYVLRHAPESVGITLDAAGRVPVADLARALGVAEEAVCAAANAGEKRRFIVEGPTIRALQGHSVAVELPLVATRPPDRLFHGTVARFIPAILDHGLVRGERRHVHLSAREEDARVVGARRGAPVCLVVRAGEMWAAGDPFYQAENGVWLTDHVPPAYIERPTPPSP